MTAGAYEQAARAGLDELVEAYPDHVLVPAPAVGSGLVFPLDSRWDVDLIAARFTLSTSAVVANRLVSVDVCDAEGTPWLRSFAPVVQAAGVAGREYDFELDATPADLSASGFVVGRLVKYRIPGGWQLRVNVAAIDVGDQLSTVRLLVVKHETG